MNVTENKNEATETTATATAAKKKLPLWGKILLVVVIVLAALAACADGTTEIVNAARLRLKESDRLRTTAAVLSALGADVRELPDGLVIHGRARLSGGTVDSCGDHRIAMAAAVAACACTEPVVITGAQAVEKSYPRFWADLEALKGGAL